jgi:H+-transporting ATPase
LHLLDSTTPGLSESEAAGRIAQFGHNEIAEPKPSAVRDLLVRFWGPMPWLLELTIFLSLVLGRILDAGIVAVLLIINVAIGYSNSSRSQKALRILRKHLSPNAKVLRDGEWKTVETRVLVPGDIILIGLGDVVPADGKVIRGDVMADQSALTGESLPVSLLESDVVYSGTTVTEGECVCVVLNTGEDTTYGATAKLVREAHPVSHQTKIMLGIARYSLYFSLVALLVTLAYAFAVSSLEMTLVFELAIMFLMGSIPVALPAVLAVAESVVSLELARKGALVTRLDSVEDAASIDVACIDKTGTITQNRLSICDVIPIGKHSKEEVMLAAALASQAGSKDLLDHLAVDYAKSLGVPLDSYEQTEFTPFAPSLKRSEATVRHGKTQFKVVKGAPQIVLGLCAAPPEATSQINEKLEELSREGYRTLAVAMSDSSQLEKLNFIGLVVISDPIRPDAEAVIEKLRKMGVKPLMLTGDHLSIAKVIARQASIGERIVRLADAKDALDLDDSHVLDYDGFAEIYPENKYEIVKLLQSGGHMVGMTGDGVNDAPALKQAEMGIAVKGATDVAKASASVVLTEEGVGVIAETIMTSRKVYQRMLSWVLNKVSKTIQVVGILTLGFIWLQDLVVSVIGMVLIIFSNDFLTIPLTKDNVTSSENPSIWSIKNISLTGLAIGLLLIVQGGLTILVGREYFLMNSDTLRSFMIITLIFTSQFRVLIVRERKRFWSSRPGKELAATVIGTLCAFSLIAVFGIIIPPLSPQAVLFSLVFSSLFMVVLVDPLKHSMARRFHL